MPNYTHSEFQQKIAARLGLDVAGDSYDVAAARIMDSVALAVKQFPAKASSPEQRKFARSLKLNVAKDSMRVTSAKISDALLATNKKTLDRLKLSKGDKVIFIEEYETESGVHKRVSEHVVSSIGSNARVYFKGIGCQGAWPTQLKKAGKPAAGAGD
jgi:hypothetical protein